MIAVSILLSSERAVLGLEPAANRSRILVILSLSVVEYCVLMVVIKLLFGSWDCFVSPYNR